MALLRQRKGLEKLIKALPAVRENLDVCLRTVAAFESEEYRNRIYALPNSLRITPLID